MRLSPLLFVALASACSGKESAPPAPAPSVVVPSPSLGSGSAVGHAVPKTTPPADAAVPEDPAVRAAYRKGMRAGRKATDAKRYAAAIAGFDAALAAKPNDARALGERGYARLLAGTDLDAAMRDLDASAGGTKNQKHLSTIWFNRGLIHEKRGDAANATASFAIANLMRPTKAAAAKLAGKTVCPVEVTRTFSVEDHPPLQAADWAALEKLLPHMEDSDDVIDEPSSLPAILTTQTSDQDIAYAVWKTRSTMFATPVGMAWRGRCSGELELEFVDTTDAYHHITGTEMAMGGHTFMCESKDGGLDECTGADEEVAAGTACLGGSQVVRDLVVDIVTGRVVIAVEQLDTGTARPKIDLDDKTLTIRGHGCARSEAL